MCMILKYLIAVCLCACLAMQGYAQDSTSMKKVNRKICSVGLINWQPLK